MMYGWKHGSGGVHFYPRDRGASVCGAIVWVDETFTPRPDGAEQCQACIDGIANGALERSSNGWSTTTLDETAHFYPHGNAPPRLPVEAPEGWSACRRWRGGGEGTFTPTPEAPPCPVCLEASQGVGLDLIETDDPLSRQEASR